MSDIFFLNNIKELLFKNQTEKQVEKHLQELFEFYQRDSSHIWYDAKYLNTCLELFLTYYNKIKEPYALFYAFFFSQISSITLLHYNLEFSIKNKIRFLNNNDSYCANDAGITESDFDFYKSILLYSDYFYIKNEPKYQIYTGLSFESERGLSFKFKRTN